MKAAVHTRYGPPEVVQVTEIDEPTIEADELLIKVHATTVNRTDCGFRAGKPFIVRFFSGLTRPRATVLGNEFAGVVEAIGSDVRSFKVGDRVFGYNDSRFGAHAEYLSIPESKPLAAMPENLAFEQAAPSTEGSHYALSFIRAAKIQDGQDVLVYGATGAIGSAAVQLLRGLGANVTAVCSTEYVELVKGLGAERVIDYTVQDFTKDWESYDVVLDAVGKSSFGQCKPLLRPTGLYLSSDLGPHSQNPILALITPIIGGGTGPSVSVPTARTPRHSGGFMLLNSLSETRATRAAIDQARASCAPGSEPPEQPAGETAQRQNLGGRIECIHGPE